MREKDFLIKTLAETTLTRRSFLKWSAALGGTAALTGGLGYGFKKANDAVQAAPDGKWIPAACWGDCGVKGFNKVYVEDGIIRRQGTDDLIKDSPENPQLRSCSKGRGLRNSLFAADRLKFPMKRKNWEPGGGRKELRGNDDWIRISWDEALDIVASELKRVKETYGNQAILANWVGIMTARVLGLYGGFVDNWGEHSSGSWAAAGITGFGADFNDRLDQRNTQLFIMWGYNLAWSRAGNPTYNYFQYKKKGARFICIDPFYQPTAQVLADEWIPIRPATDHTLVLGMAHTLITEDHPTNNPLIDWDFLNSCTVGFDKDHMPEGVDPTENFKDYVLGTYDGQPKTPEWASSICGVPPDRIRSLAREIASTNRVAICMSSAPARVNNSDSWPHAIMTFGFMTGHIGKSGSMIAQDFGHAAMTGGPGLVNGGWIINQQTFTRAPQITNPLSGNLIAGDFFGQFIRPSVADDKDTNLMAMNETWDAILKGKFTAGYNDIRDVDIKLIYHAHGSRINQLPGTIKAIEVHRKVEFVVTQNLFFNPDAKYSDIVLPVTSQWERFGNLSKGFREHLLWTSQITEPFFESKDDIWIGKELGIRLGIDPNLIQPWSIKQEIFNNVADALVISENGKSYEPLVTITDQDINEFGVEGKPQSGRIPIKEFKEKGMFHVLRKEGDKFGFIALKDFRDNPELYPLSTPSGKYEIHCQTYADYVKKCGWTEISPIPKYNKPIEGYEDTFSDFEQGVKGDFPLQKIDLHVLRRNHSTFDGSPWLREVFPFQFIMNPIDAKNRGIVNGDTVLVTSRHGKVLRIVTVSDRIMPGVVGISQGSWVDIDEETGIDKGGCMNVLTGVHATGQGHMGLNSCVVQVEKWLGKPLEPDNKWSPSVPLKEA